MIHATIQLSQTKYSWQAPFFQSQYQIHTSITENQRSHFDICNHCFYDGWWDKFIYHEFVRTLYRRWKSNKENNALSQSQICCIKCTQFALIVFIGRFVIRTPTKWFNLCRIGIRSQGFWRFYSKIVLPCLRPLAYQKNSFQPKFRLILLPFQNKQRGATHLLVMAVYLSSVDHFRYRFLIGVISYSSFSGMHLKLPHSL